MEVIRLEQVSKRFGSVLAVGDVSFAAEKGQCLALLGPSGCGKTTTLRMIAGFEQPDTGRIILSGQDVSGRRPYERNVGLVFQDYALFPHLSVRDNVAFGLRHRGFPKSEIAPRISARLAQVKLSGYEERRPSQLSGGEQQRVALARALATEPDVLLLDEPLSNLDAKLRESLRTELRQLINALGTTTIIVTHDQEEAIALGDIVVVMSRGRVEQVGTPEDIYDRPSSRFVADFIGRSNWLAGTVSESDGRTVAVRLAGGETVRSATRGSVSGRVEIMIRPERMVLAEPGEARNGWNAVAGRIQSVEFHGAMRHLRVATGSGVLLVIEPRDGRPARDAGATISIRFSEEACIVLPAEAAPHAAAVPAPEDAKEKTL